MRLGPCRRVDRVNIVGRGPPGQRPHEIEAERPQTRQPLLHACAQFGRIEGRRSRRRIDSILGEEEVRALRRAGAAQHRLRLDDERLDFAEAPVGCGPGCAAVLGMKDERRARTGGQRDAEIEIGRHREVDDPRREFGDTVLQARTDHGEQVERLQSQLLGGNLFRPGSGRRVFDSGR